MKLTLNAAKIAIKAMTFEDLARAIAYPIDGEHYLIDMDSAKENNGEFLFEFYTLSKEVSSLDNIKDKVDASGQLAVYMNGGKISVGQFIKWVPPEDTE